MLSRLKLVLSMCFIIMVCLVKPTFADDENNEALMPKGMWKDPDTGLIWMRCSLGQTWNGSGCDGKTKEYRWWDAIKTIDKLSFAEKSDWRLPTISELSSLMEGSVLVGKEMWVKRYKYRPWDMMNKIQQNDVERNFYYSGVKGYKTSNIFKPEGYNYYWSGSPLANNSNYAWSVLFDYGQSDSLNKDYGYYARAVRSSQSLGSEALLGFSQLTKTIVNDEAVYHQRATAEKANIAKAAAKVKQDAIEAKQREKQERNEEAKRIAYENSPVGRAEAARRQQLNILRQTCELQKKTCIASCPRFYNWSGERTDLPDASCERECKSVSCF